MDQFGAEISTFIIDKTAGTTKEILHFMHPALSMGVQRSLVSQATSSEEMHTAAGGWPVDSVVQYCIRIILGVPVTKFTGVEVYLIN